MPDGGRARRCAAHQLPGMVDVVSRKCEEEGCQKVPTYGMPDGGRARLTQTDEYLQVMQLRGQPTTATVEDVLVTVQRLQGGRSEPSRAPSAGYTPTREASIMMLCMIGPGVAESVKVSDDNGPFATSLRTVVQYLEGVVASNSPAHLHAPASQPMAGAVPTVAVEVAPPPLAASLQAIVPYEHGAHDAGNCSVHALAVHQGSRSENVPVQPLQRVGALGGAGGASDALQIRPGVPAAKKPKTGPGLTEKPKPLFRCPLSRGMVECGAVKCTHMVTLQARSS